MLAKKIKGSLFILNEIKIILIIQVTLLFSCFHKDSGWGDAITKQTSQPGSIFEVDSAVVAFMANYHIPGLSIAITKNGNLVYSRGFGYADISAKKEVTESSLFCIGHISQTITAVAIMKLIQNGKLSLDEKVFGKIGVLGNKFGTRPYTVNVTNITVNNLLHHTCGGWSGIDDPMEDKKFRNSSFSQEQLLSWTLNNIPLKTVPGNNFAYSNFGYFVLGRIIEKISGKPYSTFVKDSILYPVGITDMDITGNFENKKKNEVTYYKDLVFPIYNGELDEDLYISRADACSGWIASATDLLRLIVRVDGFSSKKDILDSSTIRMMLTPSKANRQCASGWFSNNEFNDWGYLSEHFGTTSRILRANNGFCLAILVNTNRPAIDDYLKDLDHIVWNVINNHSTKWPTKELF